MSNLTATSATDLQPPNEERLMYLDLRSPAAKAKWEREQKARRAKEEKLSKQLSAQLAESTDWTPIEGCPFKALNSEYGIDGIIWVSNGKDVALATVRKRFGRPMRVVKQPEMAITDNGMGWVGGEYAEIEAPGWWFEWELTDQFGNETYAGGEPTGKKEVGFVATHWMAAKPLPPKN